MILRRIGLSVLACFAITACGETTPAPQDTDTSLVAVDPEAEAEVLAWSDLLPEQIQNQTTCSFVSCPHEILPPLHFQKEA